MSRLLREEATEGDAQAVRSLSVSHTQPLVVRALLTAFQRSLTQELRERLGEPSADDGSPWR